MLYWIWFALLSLVGFILMTHSYMKDEKENTATEFIMGVGLLVLGLYVAWEGGLSSIWIWLVETLPQTGTDINLITAGVLYFVGCLIWIFWLVPLLLFIEHITDKERKSEGGSSSDFEEVAQQQLRVTGQELAEK